MHRDGGPSDSGARENYDFIFMSHGNMATLQTEYSFQEGPLEDLLALLIYYLKGRGEVGSLESAVKIAPHVWGEPKPRAAPVLKTETSNDGVMIEFPSVDMAGK
jgi:hypothetical protein